MQFSVRMLLQAIVQPVKHIHESHEMYIFESRNLILNQFDLKMHSNGNSVLDLFLDSMKYVGIYVVTNCMFGNGVSLVRKHLCIRIGLY